MSDEGARGPLDAAAAPLTTVPLAARPQVGHPHATQMSASAVPSTLESPQDPPKDLLLLGSETIVDASYGETLRDDTARDNAIHEATRLADAELLARQGAPSAESSRGYGPATLLSKPRGGREGGAPPGPRDPLESAVVDAVLPPEAFLPAGGSNGALGVGSSAAAPHPSDDAGAHAQWGAPGPHAGAFDGRPPRHESPGALPGQGGSLAPPRYPAGEPRRSSAPMIVLIVVGVVVVLGALALIGGGALFIGARRAAGARAAEAPSTVTPPEGAGLPAAASAASTTRAMGGTKARLSTLTSGSIDIEGARAAMSAALPRIDACFATSELEPPNHESVAYDMEVAASGAVKSAEPGTLSGRVAKLDTCVVAVLRAVRMPRSQGGGRVKVTLAARIADPQPPR